MTRRIATAVVAAFVVLVLSASRAAADIPKPVQPGFQDVALTLDLPSPTAVRFAGGVGGRMFVALKNGRVLAYDQPQDPTPTQVIDLRSDVNDFWDRGLLGMALDPAFTLNGGWMYLLYARDATPSWNDQCAAPHDPTLDGCVVTGKLVRVMIGPLGVATGAPQTLIQDEWCQQFPSHSVGTVAFGPDGMLYVSAGEGANLNAEDYGQWPENPAPSQTPTNPCGDPFTGAAATSQGGALRAQDVRTGGDPTGLSGAVIRIDPATGAPAPGNPFYASGHDTNAKRIIAYGLRNPFRFAFRPGTSDIWLGDVGWFRWEEINKLPVGGAAENFGWPCFEGNDPVPEYSDVGLCASLPSSQVTKPVYPFTHSGVLDGCPGTTGAGSSVSGVAFYGDGAYPDAYNGGMFFTDFARSCIWFMPPGASGDPNPAKRIIFARGTAGDGPVDLQIAPNGNLVFVYHHGQFGAVHEIRPDTALSASIKASTTNRQDFTFDASGSRGTGLSYEWDFGDGAGFVPGDAVATKHYTTRAAVNVTVKVSDGNGDSSFASTTIGVLNTPPTASIAVTSAPAGGWSVGDALNFHGAATDPDAGDTPDEFEWQLTILHCVPGAGCHRHDVETRTTQDASFIAPDHDYPSKLEVTMTARDDLGFTSSRTIVLEPRTARVTVRATAPVTVRLGGTPGSAVSKTFIRGATTTASTTTPQRADGQDYRFMGWTDGSTAPSRTFKALTNTTLTARFLSRPGALGRPVIDGSARTRRTLSAGTGRWLGNELTYAYRWLRCATSCAPIGGATASTYRVRNADLGKRIAVRVTARNQLGSATQTSRQTDKTVEGVPPSLKLSGAKKAELGAGRLKLTVRCPSERCTVRANGLLRIEGRKSTKTRTVRKSLRKGKRATLVLRLTSKQLRAAERALRTGGSVSVRWAVTASDKLANRRTGHFTQTLRR